MGTYLISPKSLSEGSAPAWEGQCSQREAGGWWGGSAVRFWYLGVPLHPSTRDRCSFTPPGGPKPFDSCRIPEFLQNEGDFPRYCRRSQGAGDGDDARAETFIRHPLLRGMCARSRFLFLLHCTHPPTCMVPHPPPHAPVREASWPWGACRGRLLRGEYSPAAPLTFT